MKTKARPLHVATELCDDFIHDLTGPAGSDGLEDTRPTDDPEHIKAAKGINGQDPFLRRHPCIYSSAHAANVPRVSQPIGS